MIAIYSKGKKVSDKILLRQFDAEDVGIFESLRTYRGRIFRAEEHIQRFIDSARTSGMHVILSRTSSAKDDKIIKMLRNELESALAAFKKEHPRQAREDVFIRLTLLPFGAKQGPQLLVLVTGRKHAPQIYRKGVVLRTSSVRRSLSHASPPQAKTSAYQNALLATLEPAPGHEWVFLDQSGFVTEVRIGNLFMIKKNVLTTPPATGILNGVTRRFVIECARQVKLAVLEVPVTRHDLFNADEAFLTNTSWEILPVRELDGRKIGRKIPGPVTQKLQNVFKKKAAACL